jgi:predicted nuclease of predicted toxin-antitoxin system
MAKLSFYFDENIQTALADALKTRGIDVVTTQEAGNVGVVDIRQLAYATEKGRTILSYNKRDFALIHYQWMRIGRPHAGIILSDQLPIGVILRRLMRLYYSVNIEDMKNRLEYLGAWK